MTIDELLCKKVSFQQNAWTPLGGEFTIREVLDFIKRGRYAADITRLRTYLESGDTEKYESSKKRLPSVTFCATFDHRRRRADLKFYNQLIVVDIDKLSQEELTETKRKLLSDDYIFAFWKSPSQTGLKGLVQLSYDFPLPADSDISACHKHAFDVLVSYFSRNYGIDLDMSGSDTTRLCFLSHDPNLVLKEDFKPFLVGKATVISEQTGDATGGKSITRPQIPGKQVRNVFLNPQGKNSPYDRATTQSIIKFLRKRDKSITSTYDNWYRVAFAISNSFTFDIGGKYYLQLCRLDGPKHDELQSKNLLRYCYENSKGKITFDTIVYLAKEQGYKVMGGSEGD
jgi:hypothetical protein